MGVTTIEQINTGDMAPTIRRDEAGRLSGRKVWRIFDGLSEAVIDLLPSVGDPWSAGLPTLLARGFEIRREANPDGTWPGTSLAFVNYAEPGGGDGGGGGFLPPEAQQPGMAWTIFEPGAQTINQRADIETGELIDQGRGAPRDVPVLLATVRVFQEAPPPIPQLLQLAAAPLNENPIRLPPAWSGNGVMYDPLDPGQMRFVGTDQVNVSDGVYDIAYRVQLAEDFLHRWAAFNAAGELVAEKENIIYPKSVWPALWPGMTVL